MVQWSWNPCGFVPWNPYGLVPWNPHGLVCIPYGIQWNPCEFHMELIIPWPFHHHSTWIPCCPWKKKLAGVSANIHSMDSLWNS